MDSSEMGKRGGRARAQRLSAQRRREIAIKASAEAKKLRSKRQKRIHELLVAIYDNLAAGWKISLKTTLGKGPETILMRTAELLREFANQKSKKDIPNGSPNSKYICEMLAEKAPPKADKAGK